MTSFEKGRQRLKEAFEKETEALSSRLQALQPKTAAPAAKGEPANPWHEKYAASTLERRRELDRQYREVRVPAAEELFRRVNVKNGPIFADYINLQRKHPEEFAQPGKVKQYVEYVADDPTHIIPAAKPEYTMLIRRNGKDRVAVVKFELKGGKYRVRSAYTLDQGQLERKLGNQQEGSQGPHVPGSDQPEPKPSPGRATAPSDAESVDSTDSIQRREEKPESKPASSTKSQPKRKGFQPATMDLTQAVRALGGIRYDKDLTNKGELSRVGPHELGGLGLGLVNTKTGMTAEDMALRLATEGYRGDWVKVSESQHGQPSFQVNGNDFLDALEQDARGARKSYSEQNQKSYEEQYREEFGDSQSLEALDKIYADEHGKALAERVVLGNADEAEIEQFRQLAREFGVEQKGIDAVTNEGERAARERALAARENLQGTAGNGAQPVDSLTPDQLAEGYTLGPDGTLIDPEGNALFDRPQQLGFTQEGLLQEGVDQGATGRPSVPEQQQAEQSRALKRLQESPHGDVKRIAALIARRESTIAGPDAQLALDNLTKALDTYEQLRTTNTPLVDYLKQENLFDARTPLTSTQEGMLRAFQRHGKSPQALDRIITAYLHGLAREEEANTAQATLFRRRRKAELEALRIRNATVSDLLKQARTKPRRYRLAVNDAAGEIFNRLHEQRNKQVGIAGPVRFDGVFNQPSLVRELLGQLRELAKENKADKPAIIKIGRALKQAAAEDGTAIVYRKASSLPEEAFHRASYLAARVKRLA